MLVTIIPHGYLKEPLGDEQQVVSLATGATVQEALDQLPIPQDLVVAVVVNGMTSNQGAVLKDGDRVDLLPLISGG